MSADTSHIVEGMDVVGPTGENIGRVKERRQHHFILDRRMRRDILVPYGAARDVAGRTVVLDVAAERIDDQGWEHTELFGVPEESDTIAPPEDRVVGTGDPQSRGGWSASSDSYQFEPLDTTEGRQAVEGADDGERPRPAGIDPNTTRRSVGQRDAERP